ncbi:PHP domain-containing protein [Chloroflexota bacterium]
MELLKADLHVHTRFSMDCQTQLENIINRCKALDISCIAVADHGTAEGALLLQKIAPFKVIVAEEILTPHGEIMGMFLKQTIPTNITVKEAISHIKAQGGLVCVPHPFDKLRHSALGSKVLEEIIDQVDVIEVFNARNPVLQGNGKAQSFARRHGKPGSAGSDAHTPNEIGNAYIEMPEFHTPAEFLKALSIGRVHGHRSNPFVHFKSTWAKIKRKF